MRRVVVDIESNNLLQQGLDYTGLPYKLKTDYKVWCIVCRDVNTNYVSVFKTEDEIRNKFPEYLKTVDEIIGHNICQFDMIVLMLYLGIKYKIGYIGEDDTLFGRKVKFWDTLILSKLLYSDTIIEHSLGAWGKRLGDEKIDFHNFSEYSEEMVTYCIQDTAVNAKLFHHLMKEYSDHLWEQSYALEKKIVDITVQQEHYGFKFNKELAEKCVIELDSFMQEIAAKVNPLLPPKKLNKGECGQYIPPVKQFKKDGSLSALMTKWLEKHSATVKEVAGEFIVDVYGKSLTLPIPPEPVVTEGPATIDDIEHVKWYLMELGWVPSQHKERDLTVDQTKKRRSPEDYVTTVERYVKQTLEGLYKDWRLDILQANEEILEQLLLCKDIKKPVRVPTSPTLTVGVEKEICPNLLAMADKFPFAKDVVNYYTYKHRRNSIAGGLDEEGEPTSGFLAQERISIDGRIPTPADTNGASSGRYQHKVVCNIARVTSLYGDKMRALFGVDISQNQLQLGFDFASLEAVCQAHFCYPYKEGPELAVSLMAKKPNDIHSVNARKMGVDRNTAKTLGYSLLYGAQPAKLAKSLEIPIGEAKRLYNSYWESVPALTEFKAKLEKHWEHNNKKWVRGIDGRKVYTRSKHSLVNYVFQNAGALLSKYTVLNIMQKLEELGLRGDIFSEDVHRLPRVMQMVVNHDEVQYSLHKSLVKFSIFGTEEEALKVVTSESSPVGHGRKWYVCNSDMYGIIRGAIDKTTEMLKFRVPLGFEWQVSTHWGGTH